MNTLPMIFGAVAIVLGFLALVFSSAIIQLAQKGEIPESDVLYIRLRSGNHIPVMQIVGALLVVPGVLLIVIPAVEYFVSVGHTVG